MSGKQAASLSIGTSTQAYEVFAGGERLAIWGWAANSILGRSARVWLLSCPGIVRYSRLAAREAYRQVAWLSSMYPVLEILVHVKYEKSLRWVRRLGFHFAGYIITAQGEAFLMMRREV